MGLLGWVKQNSRKVSDATAGTPAYFELATTNLSLYRALRAAAAKHLRGRVLDAGAGRRAYRAMLEGCCDACESLDIADAEGLDHVADLQATGLPDGAYDAVFCTQVLQHLPEPGLALGEIARILKPGGRVVISAPHLVWLHNEPHDYLRFTCHGLRHLLSTVGLTEVAIEPVGGLICFLAYAPSTLLLALLWPVRPLFHAGLWVNKAFIRLALLADKVAGIKSLYPVNYVVVAQKAAGRPSDREPDLTKEARDAD